MKKPQTRRILLLLGCAVLLVCLSVGATLAYLTSTTQVVTNTFTVGNVTIDLDETDVTVYGDKDTDARVKANEYKLIPGHSYTKDPTIHVAAGSEKCWLFVKVVNDISAIENADPDTSKTIAAQMAAQGWKPLTIDSVEVPNVYYYYQDKNNDGVNDPVDALTTAVDVKVFESFELADNANVAAYVGDDGKVSATITVQAYAVQADGFATAADAYKAAPLDAWKTASGS